MTFRELIESKYLAVGFTKTNALAAVTLGSGVCKSSAEAAFNGNRVLGETARDLASWAKRVHKVVLDKEAMMMADPRPKKGIRRALERMDIVASAALESVQGEWPGHRVELVVKASAAKIEFAVVVIDCDILKNSDRVVAQAYGRLEDVMKELCR